MSTVDSIAPAEPGGSTARREMPTDGEQKKLASIATAARIADALSLFSPVVVLAPVALLGYFAVKQFGLDRSILLVTGAVIAFYVVYCLTRSIGLALGNRALLAIHVVIGGLFVALRTVSAVVSVMNVIWTPLLVYQLMLQWRLLAGVWSLCFSGAEDRKILRGVDMDWLVVGPERRQARFIAARALTGLAGSLVALVLVFPTVALLAGFGPVAAASAMGGMFPGSGEGNAQALLIALGVATLIITLVLTPLMLFASGRLLSLGRSLARETAVEAMAVDARPPILFLRSFRDDQVRLPERRYGLFDRLLALGDRRNSLDHMLVDEFRWAGPIVGIGRPGEAEAPFGAARIYVPDSEWQAKVRDLAERAALIVLVVDGTEGVRWELHNIAREAFSAKTLLIASPALAAASKKDRSLSHGDLQQAFAQWGAEAGSEPIPGVPLESLAGCYALYQPYSATPQLFQSGTIDAYAYRFALRWTLRAAHPPERIRLTRADIVRRLKLPAVLIAILAVALALAGTRMLATSDVKQCTTSPTTETCVRVERSWATSSKEKNEAGQVYGRSLLANDPEAALNAINAVLARDANNWQAHEVRGLGLAKRGDWTAAAGEFETTLRLAGTGGAGAEAVAEDLAGLGDQGARARAVAYFDQAIAREPKNPDYLAARGSNDGHQGDYEKAIADLDAATRLAPKDAGFQNGSCWWRAVSGIDVGNAGKHCQAAVDIDPQNEDIQDTLALLLLRLGAYKQAKDIYDLIVEEPPYTADAFFGRAIAEVDLGDDQPAKRDFAKAHEIDAEVLTRFQGYGLTSPAGSWESLLAN